MRTCTRAVHVSATQQHCKLIYEYEIPIYGYKHPVAL